MKKWARTLGSFRQMVGRCRLDLYFLFFFLNFNNKLNPVLARIYILVEIVRNGPKQPEIWLEVERGVFWYQFTYRYEKFRPFRLERNGINNNDKTHKNSLYCVNFLGFLYMNKPWCNFFYQIFTYNSHVMIFSE